MSFSIPDPAFEEYLKLREIADAKFRAHLAEKEEKKRIKKDAKKPDDELTAYTEKANIEKTDDELIAEAEKHAKMELKEKGKLKVKNNEDDDTTSDNEKNKNKVFQCKHCNKIFKSNDGLQKHYNKKNKCYEEKVLPTCDECGKTFTKPSLLKRHKEERKTSCAPIAGNVAPIVEKDEIKCEFCGKLYKNLKCLDKHKEKCKIMNNKKVFNKGKMQPGMEVLLEKVDAQDKKIEYLTELIINNGQSMNITNNMNNTLIEHQNVLLINCFGDQTFDHVDADSIFTAFRLPPPEVAPYITKKIHGKFENRNIFMRRINDNEVLVLREIGGRKIWCREGIKEVCTGLFRDVLKVILKNDSILTPQKHRWDPKTDEKMEYIRDLIDLGPSSKDIYEMSKTLVSLASL